MASVRSSTSELEKGIGELDSYLHEAAADAVSTISTHVTVVDSEPEHEHHLPEHYEYHMDKGSQHHTKEPIDLDAKWNEEPGCGCDPEKFCGKCAIFWGNHCGCPSKNKLAIGIRRLGSRILMGFLFWGFFWSITALGGRYSLPGGSLFGIIMVFLWGIVCEKLIVMFPLPYNLPPLPPLLASLFVGIILRNVPHIKVGKYIDPDWSYTLREMALGIILGEAGVEVDKEMMYKLKTVVPRLSFSPCIIEAVAYGIFSHLILGLPWMWSFMLGFVCGAVAPACVVPSMINFQQKGLGVAHGVPTLLMAAASIDDIIAINGFNILLTIKFAAGYRFGYKIGIGYDILTAIFEVVFGIVFGIVCGILMWIFPDPRQHNIVRDRTVLLVLTCWFLIFATSIIDISGAGTLATLTCSFVGSMGWPQEQVEMVASYYKSFWFLLQPLLFGLTGANVNLSELSGHTVGLTVATMVICLAIRLTVAGNAVSFLGWTHKEKFLTSISWIPKATVQAAIGGTALDTTNALCGPMVWPPLCNSTTVDGALVNQTGPNIESTTSQPLMITNGNTETTELSDSTQTTAIPSCVWVQPYPSKHTCDNYYKYSTIILQVSVIVIIFTAPIGVFLIGLSGPKLLTVGTPEDEEERKRKKKNEESIELGDIAEKEAYANEGSFESDSGRQEAESPPPLYMSHEAVANTRM